MVLDFTDIKKCQKLTTEGLAVIGLEEWKKDILEFMNWYFTSDEPLKQKTSGSTGTPKDILLTKEVVEKSAEATISFFNLTEHSHGLLCIPAKFIGGKMMILRAILGRWKLTCIEPKSDLTNTLKEIASVDFSAMIPLQVQKIMDTHPSDLKRIKNLIIGGAPVSRELEKLIYKEQLNAYSTYGMTETASHVALKKIGVQSEFTALEGITFSVDKHERLVIHGARVPHSPLKTNDVVQLLSDKTFIWLGRYDHVINSGGVKIIAEELEKVIATQLRKPFYISKETHPELGETPVLNIEDSNWEDAKISSFLNKLKEILPPYWAPKKVLFKQVLDRTASGKIKRN